MNYEDIKVDGRYYSLCEGSDVVITKKKYFNHNDVVIHYTLENSHDNEVRISNFPSNFIERDAHLDLSNTPQGTKQDADKPRYSLIPPYALKNVAELLTYNLSVHKEDNWRYIDNPEKRYLDSMMRHLESYRMGEIYDKDSKYDKALNITAVVVNALFLLEFILDPKLSGKAKDE